MENLAAPTQAPRGDRRPLRLAQQCAFRVCGMGKKDIPQILAPGDRGEGKSLRKTRRQVLQTVHGKIDLARQECVFDLACEEPFVSDV